MCIIPNDTLSIISKYCNSPEILFTSKSIKKSINKYIKYITHIVETYNYNYILETSMLNGIKRGCMKTIVNGEIYKSYYYNGVLNGKCAFMIYDDDYQQNLIRKGVWLKGMKQSYICDYLLNGKLIRKTRYENDVYTGDRMVWSYTLKGDKILMYKERNNKEII